MVFIRKKRERGLRGKNTSHFVFHCNETGRDKVDWGYLPYHFALKLEERHCVQCHPPVGEGTHATTGLLAWSECSRCR